MQASRFCAHSDLGEKTEFFLMAEVFCMWISAQFCGVKLGRICGKILRKAPLLLITPDFLWITLLELCIKPVQTGGERGDFTAQICGQFVDRQR